MIKIYPYINAGNNLMYFYSTPKNPKKNKKIVFYDKKMIFAKLQQKKFSPKKIIIQVCSITFLFFFKGDEMYDP